MYNTHKLFLKGCVLHMVFLCLSLIPNLVIMSLLIFNKKFSEKYNTKKAISNLTVQFFLNVFWLARIYTERSVTSYSFSTILLLLTYMVFPFITLYYTNTKRKRTIFDKTWVKVILSISFLLIGFTLCIIIDNYKVIFKN